MIHILCGIIGLVIGGAAAFFLAKSHYIKLKDIDLSGIRWEKTNKELNNDALRMLRKHYPTHDILTNIFFLDLVQPKGKEAIQISKKCSAWTVGIVMIEKRTGALTKVIVWNNDPDKTDKTWILKRHGYKVYELDISKNEKEIIQDLAA